MGRSIRITSAARRDKPPISLARPLLCFAMVSPSAVAHNRNQKRVYAGRAAALVLNPVLCGATHRKSLQQLSQHSNRGAGNLPQEDLGSTRSSMRSFVTRSSVTSAENTLLREQNAELLNQLSQIKGQHSTQQRLLFSRSCIESRMHSRG